MGDAATESAKGRAVDPRATRADDTTAAAAPLHPAFAALSPWLGDGIDALSRDRLNELAARGDPRPVTAEGAPVRFVAPTGSGSASAFSYEAQILATGEVPTRAGSRHDAFNALCWIAYPRMKQACNALHVAAAQQATGATATRRAESGTAVKDERSERGALRDALTLFDESGVIALCADAVLGELLRDRRWKTLFCERRAAAIGALRFFVCGHALYEKLLAPYAGITGRVLVVPVAASLLDCTVVAQRPLADMQAAGRLGALRSMAEIPPLPLAGIPGWDRRNAVAAFYDDRSVFRTLSS